MRTNRSSYDLGDTVYGRLDRRAERPSRERSYWQIRRLTETFINQYVLRVTTNTISDHAQIRLQVGAGQGPKRDMSRIAADHQLAGL
jgi:hypothetical protein